MASTDLQRFDRGGPDPWGHLSKYTPARIALGRAGGSLRTPSLLDFRLSHARARDAVRAPFDGDGLRREIVDAGMKAELISTAALDKEQYLVRPDLGRALSEASRAFLREKAGIWGARDLAIIVSDGLSAMAAHRQAVPLLRELIPILQAAHWTLYPILIASFGRVKLQDEAGSILGARQSLMLLGERPGLGAPDSLGAYLTWGPSPERTDADRNCVSNIRPDGLPPAAAARRLAALLAASARRRLSGVALKDEVESGGERPELKADGA